VSDKELHGIRITEVRTMAGPIMYRVEVLWYPSKGWATDKVVPTRTAAVKRVNELMDGLNAIEGERVVYEWLSNAQIEKRNAMSEV
jgi:hypothetical protein